MKRYRKSSKSMSLLPGVCVPCSLATDAKRSVRVVRVVMYYNYVMQAQPSHYYVMPAQPSHPWPSMPRAQYHPTMHPSEPGQPRSFEASITFVSRPKPSKKKKPPPLRIPWPELMPSHVRVAGGHKALRKTLDECGHAVVKAKGDLFYGPDVAGASASLSGESRSSALSRDRSSWPGSEFGAKSAPAEVPQPQPQPNRCVSGAILHAGWSRGNNFTSDAAWWGVRDVSMR